MDKLPRFAKVFAGRRRIVEMDISLRLRNLAEFFNSLLGRSSRNGLWFVCLCAAFELWLGPNAPSPDRHRLCCLGSEP